jgi:hypothetical protein
MGTYRFEVRGDKTCLNGEVFSARGLRCSNGLLSDGVTEEMIDNLETYSSYGVNIVSTFLMGNRFSDTPGYSEDASVSPTYSERLGRIIEAADSLGMVVLVGCLYWGTTKAKWKNWNQEHANRAIENTVLWLKENDYRNVFIDVDNEGMGRREKAFDTRAMILAGKSVGPAYAFASNFVGPPPDEADLAIHFSDRADGKPYIETEGVPENAPGGYWQYYSKEADSDNRYRFGGAHYGYRNVGVYTDEMKKNQIEITFQHLDRGSGYMLASTWLQAGPPLGPNHDPGGYGSPDDPGIRWWLEAVRERYGPYKPPRPD